MSRQAALAPSLTRRMACFVYEAMILFGLGLVPGLVGAIVMARLGQSHPAQTEAGLRAFAFVYYGIYFVWFWSKRGQTLPMQTWNIRLETTDGALCGRLRAGARYLASWIWIAPAALLATSLRWTPWQSLAAVAAWMAAYALSSFLHPRRQFWHDALCRTELVDHRRRKSA